MAQLRKMEQVTITVQCDHVPRHSAVFADSLPGSAEVSRVLKVNGCRYNGEALKEDKIFAPPPAAVEVADQNETTTAVADVEASVFTETSGSEAVA